MQLNYVLHAREKYDSYDPSCWTKVYFDDFSGGFNVYHKKHKFSQIEGGGDAEKIVGYRLAKYNDKQVEFLPEGENKSPDFRFDGQTWDVKFIDKANEATIRKSIRNAQKADNVIYYFTNNKYETMINAIDREVGYLTKMNRLLKMPDIYYMDGNSILTLIWQKQ
ncbi:hypothetical protein AGMMS4957_07300 [Bacteroidia bacterium]|nr:hypothetical protein AGMMS4957_07300 [Bacteroidia bacterium]